MKKIEYNCDRNFTCMRVGKFIMGLSTLKPNTIIFGVYYRYQLLWNHKQFDN